MKGDEKMKELISKIIQNFDFEKVHRVMLIVDWHWGSVNRVPSISNLIICAEELLREISKYKTGCSISKGGFKATKINTERDGEGLELKFILTERAFYTKWLEEEK